MDKNCHVNPVPGKVASADQLRDASLALLAVKGMGCRNCAARVRNNLLTLNGVYEVDVFLNMGMAEVKYDGQQISVHMLVDAVSRAGIETNHNYLARLIAIS